MATELKHNVYLTELETALATIKATLIENEEAANNLYINAKSTKKGSDNNKNETKRYRDQVHKYYESLSTMNKIAPDVKLLSDQIVAMANAAATHEKAATASIASAARSIELALAAVEALNSSAASINTKAENEDKGPISNKAADAYEKVKELAIAAEETTMASLRTVISSADANARYIQSYISQFSASAVSLTQAINTTTQTAKTNLDNANQKLQDALNACSVNDSACAIAELNHKSAKEANDADRIELGVEEAKKMVKEFDKQSTNDTKK